MTEEYTNASATEAEQIQQEFQAAAGRTLNSYHTEIDRLRENTVLGDGERIDAAYDVHGKAAEDYTQAVEARNARLVEREAEIRADLFGAPSSGAKTGPSFTQAILKASSATDEELAELASLAADTGDETLGKASFAVAMRRQRTDVMRPYLNSKPEARQLFRELGEMPTPEERGRALETSIPAPKLDEVRASPQAKLAAQRHQDLERVRRSQRAMGH
jgi:hypothetical protein